MHANPAIFGKHPAWPDFMEDGLPESGPLRQWSDALMGAIERTVTSGRWAAPGQPAPEWLIDFDHLLVWAAAGELAVARIWASADARGRRLYPLIILQQLDPDASLPEIEIAVQQIERLGEAVRPITDQQTFTRVRRAEAERTKLRPPQAVDRAAAWQQLAQQATSESDTNGFRSALTRALVEFEDTESLAPPTAGDKAMSASQIASIEHLGYSLRLGVEAPPLHRAATLALLLRDALHLGNHIACFTPSDPGARWVDAMIGQPTPERVWPIRAATSECPIPNATLPEPGPRVSAILRTWETGQRHAALHGVQRTAESVDPSGPPAAAANPRKPGPPRKALVLIGIAVLFLLVAIVATVLRLTA